LRILIVVKSALFKFWCQYSTIMAFCLTLQQRQRKLRLLNFITEDVCLQSFLSQASKSRTLSGKLSYQFLSINHSVTLLHFSKLLVQSRFHQSQNRLPFVNSKHLRRKPCFDGTYRSIRTNLLQSSELKPFSEDYGIFQFWTLEACQSKHNLF